jgi:hypothetical protein
VARLDRIPLWHIAVFRQFRQAGGQLPERNVLDSRRVAPVPLITLANVED